ncbi:MAG: hypothetical protein NBV68_06485 [Erythrobacter sp.]|uniref:hypothetical protein n=1 Tax=Erythrobacter sp. TaxID=1042 RepID=UPI0025DF36A1|nr:hypothetical protein [Erythrobacter sp.]MCL9999010.1 hypothetical protein [Erythrobacter sp.]
MVNQTDTATAGAPQSEPPAAGTPPASGAPAAPPQHEAPPANPVLKSLMGSVSFAVLVLAVLLLTTPFVMAAMQSFGPPLANTLLADPDAMPEYQLYWPWSLFVWLVASGGILAKVIAALAAILTVGIGVIAETMRSRWLALSIICLCLAGMLLSVLLMWQLWGEAGCRSACPAPCALTPS